jgi:hypothetical protein
MHASVTIFTEISGNWYRYANKITGKASFEIKDFGTTTCGA